MRFTQKTFEKICKSLVDNGYSSLTVKEFIFSKNKIHLNDKKVIIRHDVDRMPLYALDLARIEAKYGLRASYYFRIPASWNERYVKKISRLGHEVGLHYECLDKAGGNIKKAKQILKQDLSRINKVIECKTVAMHGNPMTKYDNRDIWKDCSPSDFGLIGEVYITMDFTKLLYYSDSGRTWEDGKFNLKDFIPKEMDFIKNKTKISNNKDIIQLINREDRNLYFLVHPNRWSRGFVDFIMSFLIDWIFNFGKIAFKIIYKVVK